MEKKKLALVGAHLDDCGILGSGLAMRYRELGWDVLFVSMANGDCGQQEMSRRELGIRRVRNSLFVHWNDNRSGTWTQEKRRGHGQTW